MEGEAVWGPVSMGLPLIADNPVLGIGRLGDFRRGFATSFTTLARDEREEIEMPDGTPAIEPELEVLLSDEETFPPPPEFTAQANASDPAIYEQAESDPEGWWESWARQLDWAEA